MNIFKKLWFGGIRRRKYKLYAKVRNKEVVQLLYWDGNYSKLNLDPNTSLILMTPRLDLKVGYRWDGQTWIKPEST